MIKLCVLILRNFLKKSHKKTEKCTIYNLFTTFGAKMAFFAPIQVLKDDKFEKMVYNIYDIIFLEVVMNKTIRDLWYGNMPPCENTMGTDPIMEMLVRNYLETAEKLYATFNEEQKKLFESYEKFSDTISEEERAKAFANGFNMCKNLLCNNAE